MSWAARSAGEWLFHSAVGVGLLLLLAWALLGLVRQPARRQRLGESGLAAALLVALLSLGPAWLLVAVPLPSLFSPPPSSDTPASSPVTAPASTPTPLLDFEHP